jgi:hypothetical protein
MTPSTPNSASAQDAVRHEPHRFGASALMRFASLTTSYLSALGRVNGQRELFPCGISGGLGGSAASTCNIKIYATSSSSWSSAGSSSGSASRWTHISRSPRSATALSARKAPHYSSSGQRDRASPFWETSSARPSGSLWAWARSRWMRCGRWASCWPFSRSRIPPGE